VSAAVVEVGELVVAGLDGVVVVVVVVPSFEEEEGRDFAAENAMPENAYLSQMIFMPASSSLIIVSLERYRNMRERFFRILIYEQTFAAIYVRRRTHAASHLFAEKIK